MCFFSRSYRERSSSANAVQGPLWAFLVNELLKEGLNEYSVDYTIRLGSFSTVFTKSLLVVLAVGFAFFFVVLV